VKLPMIHAVLPAHVYRKHTDRQQSSSNGSPTAGSRQQAWQRPDAEQCSVREQVGCEVSTAVYSSCPACVSHKLAGRKLGGERTRARADTCMPDTAACAHLGFIVRERSTAPLSACYVCQPITCSSSSSQPHASLMLLVKQCTPLAWQLLPARSDILLACKLYTAQPPKPTRRCAQQISLKLAVGTATAKRRGSVLISLLGNNGHKVRAHAWRTCTQCCYTQQSSWVLPPECQRQRNMRAAVQQRATQQLLALSRPLQDRQQQRLSVDSLTPAFHRFHAGS
jgi:hypothetical protein